MLWISFVCISKKDNSSFPLLSRSHINIIVFLICCENDTTQNERISSMIEEKNTKIHFKELQDEGVYFMFVSWCITVF